MAARMAAATLVLHKSWATVQSLQMKACWCGAGSEGAGRERQNTMRREDNGNYRLAITAVTALTRVLTNATAFNCAMQMGPWSQCGTASAAVYPVPIQLLALLARSIPSTLSPACRHPYCMHT